MFLFSVQLKEITFQVLVPERVPGGVLVTKVLFMKNSKSQPNHRPAFQQDTENSMALPIMEFKAKIRHNIMRIGQS